MFIKAPFALDEFYSEIIEDELNVKEVKFTEDVRDFTSYTFKPQLKTVGPKYGKQLGGIQKYLGGVDGNAAMDELKEKGALVFDVNGCEVSLAEEDLLITMAQKEGYVAEADGDVTVVMDTNLTEELIEEGFVFEIISKIQTMRKDSGFEVMDHIAIAFSGNDKIMEIVRKNEAAITAKVLADKVEEGNTYKVNKEWNVNGEKVASVHGGENRLSVSLNQIPYYFQKAFISIEDERFYEHKGIDYKRTAGAIFNYVTTLGKGSYGGSTITQQLVKNITDDRDKSPLRKVREWWRSYIT
jgi:hypothetical protein